MAKQRALGLPLRQVVQGLHVKYDVSTRTLYHDWQHRERWLPIILDLTDSRTAILELLAMHRQLQQYAVREYLTGDNSNAKIGALRLLRDLNLDFAELLVMRDVVYRVERLEQVKH